MPTETTIRSWKAILAALSSTAVFAAPLLGLAVAIWRTEGGTDLEDYVLLAVAAVVLLLPLRIRVTVRPEGVVVQNLLLRYRLRWEDVDAVVVEPLRASVLWRLDVWRPAVLFQSERKLGAHAYATWGLSEPAHRRLEAALRATAARRGLRWEGDEGSSNGSERRNLLVRDRHVAADERLERARHDAADVECVVCGRRAPASAMEPFGEEGDALGWYCVDEAGCSARQGVRSAQGYGASPPE